MADIDALDAAHLLSTQDPVQDMPLPADDLHGIQTATVLRYPAGRPSQ